MSTTREKNWKLALINVGARQLLVFQLGLSLLLWSNEVVEVERKEKKSSRYKSAWSRKFVFKNRSWSKERSPVTRKKEEKGKRRHVPRCAMSCTLIPGSFLPRLSSPELCKISDPSPHVTLTRQERFVIGPSLFWSVVSARNQKKKIKKKILMLRGHAHISTAVSNRKSRGRESTFLSSFRILLVFNDRPMGWEDRCVCRSFS